MGGGTEEQFLGEEQLWVWWECSLGVADEGYKQVSTLGVHQRRQPGRASGIDLPEDDEKRLGRG